MISVYKIEPSYYVIISNHRGAPAPGAPMVPTPMNNAAMCARAVPSTHRKLAFLNVTDIQTYRCKTRCEAGLVALR